MALEPRMFSSRLLALACGLLVAISAWAMVEEGAALSWPGRDDLSRARGLADKDAIPGLAIATQRQVLNTCYRLYYFRPQFDFLLLPDEERRTIAMSCERLAGAAGEQNPFFSFAFMVRAFAAADLDHVDVLNDSIVRSQAAAPNEQWIAIPRVQIAADRVADLSDEALAAHQQDLRLLASNYIGTGVLAKRYAADEDFRERIVSVVETMAPVQQRTFLRRVEEALSAR